MSIPAADLKAQGFPVRYLYENATIELNGIKVRAFDQPVLDFCEAVAALNKI